MARRSKRERRYSSAKKRVETHKTGFDRTTVKVSSDMTFFTLDRAGTRRIDVLPYSVGEGNPFADPGELHYERTFYIHRGVGANQDSYVCLAKTAKKPCPVCEHRMKLLKDPDADEQEIKDLAPKERQLWNVIDRDDPEKGVQLWDISFHLFGKLLDTEIRNADEDEDFDTFFHLENGKTLKIGVGEKTIAGRSFCEVETISFKPRKDDYDDDVLEKCHSLDDLPIVMDYDKLKAIFLQTAEADEMEDDDDEEQEEKPRRKRPKDDDDEEEQEEKPRRKKSKDDDDDEEDDVWDKKPEKKSSSKKVEISVGDMVSYKNESCEVLRVGEGGLLLEGEDSGRIYKDVEIDELTETEEEEEKPKSKPKKTKKAEVEEDEDEDGYDDVKDDKPPKKAAKPKAKAKAKAKEEEEEEEDDNSWDNWD